MPSRFACVTSRRRASYINLEFWKGLAIMKMRTTTFLTVLLAMGLTGAVTSCGRQPAFEPTRSGDGQETEQKVEQESGQSPEPNTSGPMEGVDWTVPELGMELVAVKPGRFQMGSDSGLASGNEQPVHQVAISKSFWIGKYEVTQSQYKKMTGTNPSHFMGEELPVEMVDWAAASEFCQLLTERERSSGRLPSGYEYRLPSEAEWEYCCRAGSNNDYCFGDNTKQLSEYANYKDTPQYGGKTTAPVGQFKPNGWGLYDMHGNVFEWCLDWNDKDYYANSPVTDPIKSDKPPNGISRMSRSGAWFCAAETSCRSACRVAGRPTFTFIFLGFRVVLAPVVED